MQEALTFYLPLQRGPETPPEVALLVRRVRPDLWHAGLSVCSRGDHFVKRIGRRIAYHRLCGRPFTAGSPPELMRQIREHLYQLVENRPYTISVPTIHDLQALPKRLEEMRVK